MGFAEANALLNSKGNPASKFEAVGDSHTGTLLDVDLQVVTDPSKNNEVKLKKDGSPQEQIVITWQTEERDPEREGDTGIRKLYCSWRMEAAIKAAFREAGAGGLEQNATLTVKHTKVEKVQGPAGKVNAKIYEAKYVRPVLGGVTEEKWADEPATGSPTVYSDNAIKMALSLHANGTGPDVSIISQATGIPVDFLLQEVLSV